MPSQKRVFVIGGTGFLGYHTIQEFLAQGWDATALGLPPAYTSTHSAAASWQAFYPASVRIILQNLDAASDEELLALLSRHEALVFAAGLDDRSTPKKPASPKSLHANEEVPLRLLRLAKQAGVKHVVAFGSYFAYFHHL